MPPPDANLPGYGALGDGKDPGPFVITEYGNDGKKDWIEITNLAPFGNPYRAATGLDVYLVVNNKWIYNVGKVSALNQGGKTVIAASGFNFPVGSSWLIDGKTVARVNTDRDILPASERGSIALFYKKTGSSKLIFMDKAALIPLQSGNKVQQLNSMKKNINTDNDDANNWCQRSDNGTPGKNNHQC